MTAKEFILNGFSLESDGWYGDYRAREACLKTWRN